jgi:hypothetical protein
LIGNGANNFQGCDWIMGREVPLLHLAPDPSLPNGQYTNYAESGTGVPDWVTGLGYIGIQNFAGTGDYTSMPTASPNAVFDDGSNSGRAASLYQNLTGDGSLDLVAAVRIR